ncbi:hypothetical protein OG21DRAFT_1104100 [Imleria badia]|nr:hypothetical protein OG21DRAFT_1104100 [Imleria badia]
MVGTPPITVLSVVPDENPSILSQSWRKPFEALLWLLRISRHEEYIEDHQFCFQHTHDLSELSRIFLSVNIQDSFTYEIATDSIRFDDLNPFLGQSFLAELEGYANRALSRVQVSIFIHIFIGPLIRCLDENKGLQ